MRKGIQHRGRNLSPVREDGAEFRYCSRPVLQAQVGLAAQVGGPEFGGWGMVEPPQGLEKLDGACRVPALQGDGRSREGNRQAMSKHGFWKPPRKLARQLQRFAFSPAERQRTAGML